MKGIVMRVASACLLASFFVAAFCIAPVWAEDKEPREKKAEFVGISRTAQPIVDKWLAVIEDAKSYSDEATVDMKTGMPFGGNEQKASFTYVKPDKFRITNQMMDVVSDGKELTVYRKNNKRYITETLHADKMTQIRKHGISTMAQFSLAELMLASDPKAVAADRFRNLNTAGSEEIDGDKCVILEGNLVNAGASSDEHGQPLKMFIREKDWTLRRFELDISPRQSEEDQEKEEEENPFARFIGRDMRAVYELKKAAVNQDVDKSKLAFKAPSGAKKVDKFYSASVNSGDTAQQFPLSGKPAPDFVLDSTDGKTVTLSDKKGSVVVLNMLANNPGGRMGRRFRRMAMGAEPQLEKLDQLQRDFGSKGLTVFCVQPGDSADELLEDMKSKNQDLTVLLDTDRSVRADYVGEEWGSAIVLIGKDGIVQGRYPAAMTEENAQSIRNDVEKLLKGETLAGGKPMTDEQIDEVEAQQNFYFADSDEALNEDRLAESWSVRTQSSGGMFFGRSGGGSSMKSGLWVQTRDSMQEIDPAGKIVAEIPIPRPVSGDNIQEEFAVGRMGNRRVVVHMSSIQGEERGGMFGWRPPKGAMITAGDESGNELWSIELEAKSQQVPQNLTLADVDGKGGDELLFTHNGSLWILNERGETIVRKEVPGWVSWLRVEDMDRNEKAEIYIRSQNKLLRFDYRGEK